jgi:hypothetical protein
LWSRDGVAGVGGRGVCNGSVGRQAKGLALRTSACNSVHERRQDDTGRNSAPAPVGEACNAVELGPCAAVAGERLRHGIGQRPSGGSPHLVASTGQKNARGLTVRRWDKLEAIGHGVLPLELPRIHRALDLDREVGPLSVF